MDELERDRRFLKQKMSELKEAYQNGNYSKADRIATEISQYFEFGNDEIPIESELDDLE